MGEGEDEGEKFIQSDASNDITVAAALKMVPDREGAEEWRAGSAAGKAAPPVSK
jgi:hypothetical protein